MAQTATPKRIYVLNGHPGESSLNRALAEAYADAARAAGHEIRITHLHDLDFDEDRGKSGYDDPKPLEPGVEKVLEDFEWAEHIVITHPLWWGAMPAKLKGLIDRSFLPGRTFNTRETNWLGMPKPMLSGRTGHVIVTADTPGWVQRLFYGNALQRVWRGQILGFVGIKPVRFSWFAPASKAVPGQVGLWLDKVRGLGAKAW